MRCMADITEMLTKKELNTLDVFLELRENAFLCRPN
jgi:hypothetical protein